ncbi:MAG: chemotaxis protein CheW [Rubellimicrobium sp.]|nr:chemotaxis protein CheW [Rubellimicrobium sp.]
MAAAPAAPPDEVVSFRVRDMDFCVGIGFVREIRGWTPATVLPEAQSYVTGVINLRGTVVAVIDLAARLGLGALDPGPRHVVLIVAIGERLVGLLADAVSDIMPLDADLVKPLPAQVAERTRAFLGAVVTLPDGRMLRMLDLARILPPSLGGLA